MTKFVCSNDNFLDMNTHIVIMAGGIGSRFWPMSTAQRPKQFVDILGVGKTMIQMTVERLLPLCPKENFWIVTGCSYVDMVKEQLPDVPADNILAEPAARNTAPCIAYACWKIREKHPDANIVVTPSDALILDGDAYRNALSAALAFTETQPRIVTVGICPTRPETGYGYIKSGEPAEGDIRKVDSFREKPSLEVARQYLEDGSYLWNAGIFVWNVDTIVAAMRAHAPGIAELMDHMSESFYTDDEKAVVGELFPACEKISIDYAVMEKADNIYTLPADFGWSDLGTWGSLWELSPKTEEGNAVVGENVKMIDSTDCMVHAPELGKVIIQGLDGYIVSQHGDRLLVCRKDHEQKITDYIK